MWEVGMNVTVLYRIDCDRSMAPFYRVEVVLDLFGENIVERRWGRIGGSGQVCAVSYSSATQAEVVAFEFIRKKVRSGYRSA